MGRGDQGGCTQWTRRAVRLGRKRGCGCGAGLQVVLNGGRAGTWGGAGCPRAAGRGGARSEQRKEARAAPAPSQLRFPTAHWPLRILCSQGRTAVPSNRLAYLLSSASGGPSRFLRCPVTGTPRRTDFPSTLHRACLTLCFIIVLSFCGTDRKSASKNSSMVGHWILSGNGNGRLCTSLRLPLQYHLGRLCGNP